MVTNLLDAGRWLKYSGDCVYGTVSSSTFVPIITCPHTNMITRQDYWFQGSQDITGDISVRFLTTPSTFCIVALSRPMNGQLVINKRLPILPGDEIVLLRPYVSGPNFNHQS